MNLQVIHEHTVDMDLLRTEPNEVIDIGCLGFGFTEFFDRRGDIVYPIDIQELKGRHYDRVAITSYTGDIGVKVMGDAQATKVTKRQTESSYTVPCYTLEDYMAKNGIEFADLIKIDCEGSEMEIILSLEKAPARMLSIEFHCHTGAYSKADVYKMVLWLESLGYKTVQHNYESRHGAGFNFWDSLFIHQ